MEGKPFKLLVIAIDSDLDKTRKFAKENNVNYTVLMDDSDVDEAYEVYGVPLTILLDKDGNEVLRTRGYAEGMILDLKNDIEGLLI